MLRKLSVAVACAAVIGVAGTTAAFAGEVTGPFPNGTPLWTGTNPDGSHTLHGKSECAFSGLNIPSEDGDPSRTQSFGQIVRFAGPLGGIPGTACNPTKSGGE
jgi:hypothetical protein